MSEICDTRQPGRRDFIIQAAGAFIGVGITVALWPFIDQMNPNNGTPPSEVTDVDLLPIQPGQMISVLWKGKPIFIRNRTWQELQLARATPLTDLPDRLARNEALPETTLANDSNRTKEGYENWLVVVGLCTHLNCVLISHAPSATVATGEGWYCPCHAARFDLSGRVRSGPARMNLPVPPYQFLSATMIRIG
jgi:ubiquinol-cytochrome c reductase iron-sulfur subunit